MKEFRRLYFTDEILFAFYDPVLVRMRSLSIKDYGGSIANYLKRLLSSIIFSTILHHIGVLVVF